MDTRDISDFFDRPIAFHRALVKVGGGITAALLMSQAIFWQRITDRKNQDGWWYKTGVDWLDETGMTKEEFRTARKRLVVAGILQYEVRGVPATGHYRIDFHKLLSSLRDSRQLVVGIPDNKLSGNPQSSSGDSRQLLRTETTTETSIEGAAVKPRPANGALKLDEPNPIVIDLPMRHGKSFPIHRKVVTELEPLYPAVDVVQTLNEMKGWLIGHPERRPHRRMMGFVTTWLKREQEEHGR